MKVKLLRDGLSGRAGTELSGPEVWRLAFPLRGCQAKPSDADASARIEQELAAADPADREQLVAIMGEFGTLPEAVTVPDPAPAPSKSKK
jgi:hypothetical protein